MDPRLTVKAKGMSHDSNSLSPRERRDLEYDYLVLSYEVAALVETHLREAKAIEQLDQLFTQARQCLANRPTLEEQSLLIEILDLAVREAESHLRLGLSTSRFRDDFRRVNQLLLATGRRLGYASGPF